jgi:hypothetical protein
MSQSLSRSYKILGETEDLGDILAGKSLMPCDIDRMKVVETKRTR